MQLLFASTVFAAAAVRPCARLDWGWRQVFAACNLPSAPSATPQTNAPNFVAPDGAGSPSPIATVTPNARQAICNSFGPSAPVSGVGASFVWRNRCRRALDAYGALVRACNQNPTALAAPYGTVTVQTLAVHAARAQALSENAVHCQTPNLFALTPAQISVGVCPGLAGWWFVTTQACGLTAVDINSGFRHIGITPVVPTASSLFSGNAMPTSPTTTNGWVPVAALFGATALNNLCSGAPNVNLNPPVGTAAPSPNAIWPNRNFRTSRCRRAADQFGRAARRCRLAGTNDFLVTVADSFAAAVAPCATPSSTQ